MNEEMEKFERRLSRQPMRQIPGNWRAEILKACRESSVESREHRRNWLSTFNSQLSTLLWPHPKAWAGLAAVWVFIFILNFSMRDTTAMVTEKSSVPSPEAVAELKQQQQMLVELIGARDVSDAERSKLFVPLPRSERTEIAAV